MTRRTFGAFAFAAGLNDARSYLVADSAGGILQKAWADSDSAISFGSLLKPFLVVSYLGSGAQAPVLDCHGAVDGCWSVRGHGRQNIVKALANSCNVYFRFLVNRLDLSALDFTALSYGLLPPDRNWDRTRLIGLGEGWPQQPGVVVRAFAQLGKNAGEISVRTALRGMALCAEEGTAKAIGFAGYAKTGTAICRHRTHGMGDGFALAMYPLDQPRRVLLISRHNTTGAETARGLKWLRGTCG